jgi:two-component system phosphate regulon sensor histidine kinase PhoR
MKKRRRLIWRLFPSYLLITLLSLLAVSWYATSSLRKFYIDQTAADLKARAHLLEEQIRQYLSPLKPAVVDAFCKEAGKISETRITVILPTGVVIGDSREEPRHMDNHAKRPEIAKALSGETGTSIRRSATLLQRMMYVAIPIFANGEVAVVARTSLPVTAIDEELADIRLKIAFGGLFIAIIAAAISLAISRQYSRPIEKLKEGADRFARGELDHRLALPESEELDGLAEAMNQMAEQLNNRISTIESQRRELETVLSSMLEGLIAVDNEERIISLNQAAAKWFQIEARKVQGRSIQEVIRNRALQQFVTEALKNQESMENDITVFQNGERVLNVRSSPLLDASRKRIGTLIVFNDATQLRRLENMRRDFVANVSHEIKTPLTAIKGFVETLHQNSVENPEEARRFLDIIQKHVDRLSFIVEDLLSLSKIEQEDEGRTIQLEESNIKDVFLSASQICRSKAEEKNISIIIDCDEQISAKFDSDLLEQAVVNLLDNAIKYSESESKVHLNAYRDNSEIKISVADQGIGIAKKHLSRLFERFYRVDKARSRKMGGTGLGLAIVKHIAQAHGGNVTVESLLSKGSTFTIHLPAN